MPPNVHSIASIRNSSHVRTTTVELMLYHHPVSTCSQKVRLALAEKRLQFDQHIIDWSTLEHLSDWYLAINPNGVVPTLVHGGQSILDSSVICEYLEEVYPDAPISPYDAKDRAAMRAWMRYFEEVPTVAIRIPSFNKLFVKPLKVDRSAADFDAMTERMPLRKHFYRQMHDTGFSEQSTRDSMERLRKTLERVAGALADRRPFLLGEQYTIADILLIPTVVRMEDLGLANLWSDLPAVQGWFERIQARPSFDMAYVPNSRVNPQTYNIKQGV
jgi:glutathione S-transferase